MTKHVVITGANRGIGLGFVRHYLAKGDRVTACCRRPGEASALIQLAEIHANLNIIQLDVTDESSLRALPQHLNDTAIDILINNAGYYGPKGIGFGKLRAEEWQKVLAVNTIAPIMITQTCYPMLRKANNAKVICISSKMGSMADNQSGGSYLYRSSKAGLNAALKSLAIDLRSEAIFCVVFHPGWVQTDMGGPNALITVNEAVEQMATCIDRLDASQSGQFLNFDGKVIPW
ncbi:SDR family oxidoreductase [Shewanella aquimarina]|uniref:SDR family oxidoreductase n=1 Tax=Shewanella aquimarina TaxID=260365 RepID=UPI0020149F6C|nr:SDR family oxidoreductase [Shewanella aquimarina]MCL2909401.1 SDR family oxidoreductase [Shewanella aquimarina]